MWTLLLKAIQSRFTIPVTAAATLAALGALFMNHAYTYHKVMRVIIHIPTIYPFVDWEWIPSSIRCWNEGVDVYTNNDCFTAWPNPGGFDYSPLWLRATFIQYADGRTTLFGTSFAVLFFLSLALLPPPRTMLDFGITLLATVSSATALAVERGNTDLIMFLMIVIGVWACERELSFRIAGYALITLAGLLKFYPMVALIVALRERPATVATIAFIAGASLAALVFFFHDELVRMLANITGYSYFSLQFSARELPGGLGVIAQHHMTGLVHQDETTAEAFAALLYASALFLLIASALATAIWFGSRSGLQSALRYLPARHVNFLVVGAALICGCFFVGQNVIYKGIFLLLALPGLLVLSQILSSPLDRFALRVTCFAVVFVLWYPFIEACISVVGPGQAPGYPANNGLASPVEYLMWICDELTWWWIITVLLAALGTFVVNSQLAAVASRILPLPRRFFGTMSSPGNISE